MLFWHYRDHTTLQDVGYTSRPSGKAERVEVDVWQTWTECQSGGDTVALGWSAEERAGHTPGEKKQQ